MKLYIGNIPFDAREEELRELFAAFGTLGTALGFVEFDDPVQGKAAIAGVNGTEFGGRKLVVNEARSRDGGSSGYRGSRGGYGGDRADRGSDRSSRGSGGGRPRF